MIRDVLKHLVFDYTKEELDTGKPFDQALKEIQEEIIKGLPKEDKKVYKQDYMGYGGMKKFGYNQYRQEAIEGIKKICK